MDVFQATEIRRETRELSNEHNDKVTGYEIGSLKRDGFEIGLYEFEIKSSYKIGLNRVGLRSLVKSYLNYGVDAAIVVYWQGEQWRVSFICDLKDKKTNPKRFTYLMGDPAATYRTAVDRFIFIEDNNATWQSIVDAFSVEKLSKAFFDGYKNQFRKFCEHIGGEEKWERDYVKKLLGRLVFLQFLQKKGWMGVPASTTGWKGGDQNFMAKLIDDYEGQDNILSNVLEPLFFDTLNSRRDGDIADSRLGENIKIPYLNGGLFDRSELDIQHKVDFPYTLFKGLMEFFSSYNFTIDENDPDDSDVGIDPEMLGHIFENLLEDNKDKGAFYTPKEIVQYMSRESLRQYLHSHISEGNRVWADNLILEDKIDSIPKPLASQLETLLKEVKVCDPAIGSGAFPMGVLSEIYRCRRKLYGANNTPETFSPSAVKREIIQNNIYGVDLEQGAVDIARLRFWLSLVVDEEQPEPLPNLDFKIMQGNSLLESFEGVDLSDFNTKSEHKDQLAMFGALFETEDTQEQIDDLMREYYSETDHTRKEELFARINDTVREHIKKSAGNKPEIVAKVDALDRTNMPFFLWHVFFNEVFQRGGFDIVIGNPPYIQLQNNSGFLAEQLKKEKYDTFARTGDIYCIFYEKGIDLLKDGGIETYITSSKWMRAAYGEKLRSYLAGNNPVVLIELGPGVFDSATVDTNILIVEKTPDRHELQAVAIKGKEDFQSLAFSPLAVPADGAAWVLKSPIEQSIDEKVRKYGTPLKDWGIKINFGVKTGYNEAFIIDGDKRAELIAEDPKSAELIKPLLRGRDIERYYSAVADKYIICTFPALKIDIEEYPAIKQWLLSYDEKWLRTNSLGWIADNHLSEWCLQKLDQTGKEITIDEKIIKDSKSSAYKARKRTGNQWFETQDQIGYHKEMVEEKIVWKRIGSILRFCYDDTGSVVLDSTCFSSGPNSKYLTAVLNSKMGHYLLKDAPKTGTGDLLISVQALEPVRIPPLSSIERKPFEELVDEVIRLKKQNPDADISTQEEKINDKVLKLYNLSPDEIAIIRNL